MFPLKVGTVMPRLAKHLCVHRERPFASLRVTTLYRFGLENFIIQHVMWAILCGGRNEVSLPGSKQVAFGGFTMNEA